MIFGANWILFWLAVFSTRGASISIGTDTMRVGGSPANIVVLLIALVNMAGFAFLYLYFRKPETQALFAVAPAEVAPTGAETPGGQGNP
jgi:hypothetical protein